MYLQYKADVAKMEELTELAILRSYNRQHSVHDVEKFGGGWTGEEALAIALYCSLRYLDNFEEAMIAAVNMLVILIALELSRAISSVPPWVMRPFLSSIRMT